MEETRSFWLGLIAACTAVLALGYGLWSDNIALSLISLPVFVMAVVAFLPNAPEDLTAAQMPLPEVAPAPAVDASAPHINIPLDALLDAALLVDARDKVLACNAASQNLGPIAVGDAIRTRLRHPDIWAALDSARASGKSEQCQLHSGTYLDDFILRFTPAGEGQILVSAQDIRQARAMERMRVDFVANASHELRTPLATLLGFIETLSGPAAEDGPARARFLGIMEGEAKRMARLIDDLLSLSRIEQDKFLRPTTRISLANLLEQVRIACAPRLEADGRALVIDCPPDIPEVIAVGDQIAQVLHNLVSNAEKYGAPQTPVKVEVRRLPQSGAEAYVEVAVIDQGEGIASEHLPRLTERFYRVDSGRSRAMGGTGLGLAIVKHIVERHRGALSIQSQKGQGSRFAFTLPISSN